MVEIVMPLVTAIVGAVVGFSLSRSMARYRSALESREREHVALVAGSNDLLRAYGEFIDTLESIDLTSETRREEIEKWAAAVDLAAAATMGSLRAHRVYLLPVIPIGGSDDISTAVAVGRLLAEVVRDEETDKPDRQRLENLKRQARGRYTDVAGKIQKAIGERRGGSGKRAALRPESGEAAPAEVLEVPSDGRDLPMV